MKRKTIEKKERFEHAKETLLELFKDRKDATVYTSTLHASKSRMSRHIQFYVAVHETGRNPEIVNISYHIAKVLDMKIHKNGGLIVNGRSINMGFKVVYDLSAALYGMDDRGAYKISQQWI